MCLDGQVPLRIALRRMRRLRFLLLALAIAPALPALPAQVPSLYEAEVQVSAQDPAAQLQGMQMAMRIVLVRLTGDRNAATRTAVARLLQNPEAYVQQYGYRGADNARPAEGAPMPVLSVKFDAKSIDGALREAGVRTWGRDRPRVLVWLAVQESGRERVIGQADGSAYAAALTAQARSRGLPMVFPLLDLNDEAWSDLMTPDAPMSEPIAAAARRYGAQAVLAGQLLMNAPGLFEADWTLFAAGEAQPWSSQGDLPEVVLSEGIDRTTDLLAGAISGATAVTQIDPLRLTVHGVTSLDDYARLDRYLDALEFLSEVRVTRVEPDRVSFVVLARGGVEALNRAVGLGSTLEPLASQSGTLEFELLRE